MKVYLVARIDELANSEANKVYLRGTLENDSRGSVAVRIEQTRAAGDMTIEGLAIGQRVRVTVESL